MMVFCWPIDEFFNAYAALEGGEGWWCSSSGFWRRGSTGGRDFHSGVEPKSMGRDPEIQTQSRGS